MVVFVQTELIRRKNGGEAYALTCPLITKADGGKFGKTESGNIWLDPRYTSPYKFVQFWLNVSDADAEKYIKIFTFLGREEIENLCVQHNKAPHLRLLQKRLAEEVTCMVHSREEYEAATEAAAILFGSSSTEQLLRLDEKTFLDLFEGIPVFQVDLDLFKQGVKAVDLLAEHAAVFPSKGEMRKMVQNGGLSINKNRCQQFDQLLDTSFLLHGRYLLIQKGKKNYFLITASSEN